MCGESLRKATPVKAVTIGILAVLSGCLSKNDITCRRENPLGNIEAFLNTGPDGEMYLSDIQGDIDNSLALCSNIQVSDTVGYNSIYLFSGKLIDMCDAGVCAEITMAEDPFCIPEYTVESRDVELFTTWYVAHMFSSTGLLYPSCVGTPPSLTFNREGDAYAAEGNLGNSQISFVYAVDDDGIMPSGIVYEQQEGSPYVAFFESRLANFIRNNDTLYLSITGNEMTLANQAGDFGILLYNR